MKKDMSANARSIFDEYQILNRLEKNYEKTIGIGVKYFESVFSRDDFSELISCLRTIDAELKSLREDIAPFVIGGFCSDEPLLDIDDIPNLE